MFSNMITIGHCLSLLAILPFFVNGQANVTVVQKPDDSATLNCSVNSTKGYIWYHKSDEQKETTRSLHIAKVEFNRHLGEYTCTSVLESGEQQNETFILASLPWSNSLPEKRNLVEGDPLVLACEAKGYPTPVVVWVKDDEPLDTTDARLKLSPHGEGADAVINGSLRLEHTTFDDQGEYGCRTVNEYGNHTEVLSINIKDKLAALWPFLGICAEVAVLCTIIFIYEKRRASQQSKEDKHVVDANGKEEEQPMNSSSKINDEDVRQRNSKA